MSTETRMKPFPMSGQIWRTANGHMVKVHTSYMPRPQTVIETSYVNGPVDGYRGANFNLDGTSVMFGDSLVERVE